MRPSPGVGAWVWVGTLADRVLLHLNSTTSQAELIVGDQSGAIHIWDLKTDHNEQLIPEPEYSITSAHIDPDASYMAAVNSAVSAGDGSRGISAPSADEAIPCFPLSGLAELFPPSFQSQAPGSLLMFTLLLAMAPPIRLSTSPSISQGQLLLLSCSSLWL